MDTQRHLHVEVDGKTPLLGRVACQCYNTGEIPPKGRHGKMFSSVFFGSCRHFNGSDPLDLHPLARYRLYQVGLSELAAGCWVRSQANQIDSRLTVNRFKEPVIDIHHPPKV